MPETACINIQTVNIYRVKTMETYDVVYILKLDLSNPELIYSLRSLEKNLPHSSVWFCGGQPCELMPDKRMNVIQHGANRYERVRDSMIRICENDEITENFWLFNDDFFILRPMEIVPVWYNGTLQERIRDIESRRGVSAYTQQLRNATETLMAAGLSQYNYAVHVPMLINKEKMQRTLERFPECPMLRALYGNDNEIGGVSLPDVKIHRPDVPIANGAALVSTSDSSFINGIVGKQIREMFPEKSRWEI